MVFLALAILDEFFVFFSVLADQLHNMLILDIIQFDVSLYIECSYYKMMRVFALM